MAIVQVPLEILDEIQARVLTGEYLWRGGVVRDQAGRLVMPVDGGAPIASTHEAAKADIARALTNRAAVGIALGVDAVAATTGGAAYRAKRRSSARQLGLPTSVEHYSESLATYLEAACRGRLNAEIIDRLIADLDAGAADPDGGNVTIELSSAQAGALVAIVAHHTRRLAEANGRELSAPGETHAPQGAAIIRLRPYLEAQRDLFSEAPNRHPRQLAQAHGKQPPEAAGDRFPRGPRRLRPRPVIHLHLDLEVVVTGPAAPM